jgi:hypothetical protein
MINCWVAKMSTLGLAQTSPWALPSVLRGTGDTQISKHEVPPRMELRRAERFLATESEPPVGAHVVTRRRGYTHHGIYVGSGKVVHYAGFARGLRGGQVEEISLTCFAAGHAIGVVEGAQQKFDAREVVRRAHSRLGEDCYRLLTNNCEHFCEWCLQGECRSYQIEACLWLPSRALHAAGRLVAKLLSPAGRTGLRSFTSTRPG